MGGGREVDDLVSGGGDDVSGVGVADSPDWVSRGSSAGCFWIACGEPVLVGTRWSGA